MSRSGNAHDLENVDEGTLAKTDLIPWHDSDHQRQAPEIEQHQEEQSAAKRLRHGDSRFCRFASRGGHHLDAQKTEDRYGDSEQHTGPAPGKETAVVDGPDAWESDAQQKRRSQHQENRDGQYLDHG